MRKGFTLVEMLGVLIVLGIISIIIYPDIFGSLKKYKKTLSAAQISSIESAAASYVADHINEFDCSSEKDISLYTLQEGGYINDNIRDTKKNIINGKVTVSCETSNSDNYHYLYEFVQE